MDLRPRAIELSERRHLLRGDALRDLDGPRSDAVPERVADALPRVSRDSRAAVAALGGRERGGKRHAGLADAALAREQQHAHQPASTGAARSKRTCSVPLSTRAARSVSGAKRRGSESRRRREGVEITRSPATTATSRGGGATAAIGARAQLAAT